MEDLSSMVNGVTGGESMAGGNGISQPPPHAAPGSASESTAGVSAGSPGPVIPAEASHRVTEHGSGGGSADGTWAMVQGVHG